MIELYNVSHGEHAVMGWSVGFDDETFPNGCWTNAGGKNKAIHAVTQDGYFQYWRHLSPPDVEFTPERLMELSQMSEAEAAQSHWAKP